MLTVFALFDAISVRVFLSVRYVGSLEAVCFIYEIKTKGIRLYCLQDRLSDDLPCLIIVTNGGTKNTDKEQTRDIKRAARIQAEYHLAIKSDNTTLTYNQQDDEN